MSSFSDLPLELRLEISKYLLIYRDFHHFRQVDKNNLIFFSSPSEYLQNIQFPLNTDQMGALGGFLFLIRFNEDSISGVGQVFRNLMTAAVTERRPGFSPQWSYFDDLRVDVTEASFITPSSEQWFLARILLLMFERICEPGGSDPSPFVWEPARFDACIRGKTVVKLVMLLMMRAGLAGDIGKLYASANLCESHLSYLTKRWSTMPTSKLPIFMATFQYVPGHVEWLRDYEIETRIVSRDVVFAEEPVLRLAATGRVVSRTVGAPETANLQDVLRVVEGTEMIFMCVRSIMDLQPEDSISVFATGNIH
ncbi:hypothetical protein BJ508DRAFT_311803 [Ascobolus immersus RN42]|uniref:Uncharacterized protein n=1 Tax=Ascobolus immersus RN42 TaxID=1160509 RepID=A0A3N4HP44_ASCIM|nr:hypothetical protein BJ508DRAFT_311803 [Ascobolus immersus RN42]